MPKNSIQRLWEDLSARLVHAVEDAFFALGVNIAKHPWRTIIITWAFVLLSCIGLLRFHIEKNPMKLWVPPDSDFYKDTNWYIENFQTGIRYQKVLLTADNVLDSKVLMLLYNITKRVNGIEVNYKNQSYSLRDLCFKVPIVNNIRRIRRSFEPEDKRSVNSSLSLNNKNAFFSWLMTISNVIMDDCSVMSSFELTCLQYNILDLWQNDPLLIQNASQQEIIKKIYHSKINPATGHAVDYSKYLGGTEYDNNGNVINAKSILAVWYTEVNMSSVDLNEVGNLVGTEDWVSAPLLAWENNFINILKVFPVNTTQVKVYYEAGRSFSDITGQAIFNDLDKLSFGIILMFIYIVTAISRCNWLQIRLTLGSVGLLCIGMAYVTAVGWCSIFGVSYGPVHSSLPFLLMGLGVDDMFVMNACWKNLSDEESKRSLPVKVGLMLKHAGVSIVITSFTDVVALLIGAFTILPSLHSFCIYAAVGVFFIFCYSVTFYVALFTLDLKRIYSRRNGIIFCYKHETEIPITEDISLFQKTFSKIYKNVIFTKIGKTVVILFTLLITITSIQSLLKLEQRFDPKWFVPKGTDYQKYLDAFDYYYATEGHKAMVFLGEMDYNREFSNLLDMVETLKNESYVDDLVTWVESFRAYVQKYYKRDLRNASAVTDNEFKTYLSKFFFGPDGGQFQINFKFSRNFRCGEQATNITASTFTFNIRRFQGPEQYIPFMNRVKNLVKSANVSTGDGYRSVWSKAFANWVTDEVIGVEVERNIELALLCVMVCTVILITNLQMCFWIFLCVLLTMVNVLGWMQRWGMTVDIVCCIGLELAIGLCVDYAAHVGHTFLTTSQGNRNNRALKTVTSIGSAVLLGGGSTLLSLSLLSTSKAYTFKAFFKIFLLVILFGLFNGLVFLPVILSLIGPDAYKNKAKQDILNGTVENDNREEMELEDKELDNVTENHKLKNEL